MMLAGLFDPIGLEWGEELPAVFYLGDPLPGEFLRDQVVALALNGYDPEDLGSEDGAPIPVRYRRGQWWNRPHLSHDYDVYITDDGAHAEDDEEDEGRPAVGPFPGLMVIVGEA